MGLPVWESYKSLGTLAFPARRKRSSAVQIPSLDHGWIQSWEEQAPLLGRAALSGLLDMLQL